MTATTKLSVTVCRSEGDPSRWYAQVSNIALCDRRGVNDPRYRVVNDWFETRKEAEQWASQKAREMFR
jgi:hypothetical protein